MLKKILLLLLAFCFSAESYAQTNLKDSLRTLLKKENRDTGRVMLLTKLSFSYRTNKPDTAMLLALEALTLSKRIGFVKGEAASLNQIGNAYRVLGNSSKAMEVLLQELKLEERINNPGSLATNLDNIGIIYNGNREYHQAMHYFLKAEKLFKLTKDQMAIAANLLNVGSCYLGLKQYDSALVYSQQAYAIANKINDTRGKGFALSLIGSIYSTTGQKKLALEYYRLSIPFSKQAEIYNNLSGTFFRMSKLFEIEGQPDSTEFYAKQAFEISRGILGTPDARTSSFLYTYYKKKGYPDSAYFYLEIAKVAYDSLLNKERMNKFHSLGFDEKLRQIEITAAELKGKEQRSHNLQYAAIAIALITFLISFLILSRSIIVKTKFIEFFGVLGLLAVFEFINLFIHPYLAHLTNDSPVLMLLILIVIGAMLVPLHHKLEKWITKIMVEKNKKIRLEAAKKTIASLEPN